MSAVVDLSAVRPGFADPVRDAQATFRGVLEAMAHPGLPVTLDRVGDFGARGAIALTLLDYETPVWLGGGIEAAFGAWLRFHCGCPLANDPGEARFAFVDAADLPGLARFHPGDAKYPDTAATLVIAVPALSGGEPVTLSGPGIEGRVLIAPRGLPDDFWDQAIANRARFQLGVDILFATGDRIIGLPRSSHISREG